MGQLHELLAVEPDLRSKADAALAQARAVFEAGAQKLVGQIRTYRPFDDEGEKLPDERKHLATTVPEQLEFLKRIYGAYIDATIQKEATNQEAAADLMIGDRLFRLPATALLNLESRLAELRATYAKIPANDPGEQWHWNEQGGFWQTAERKAYRSLKKPRSMVTAEATDKHPAQVHVYNEDVQVGEWTTTVQSGCVPIPMRQQWLQNIDELLREVKKARMRANTADVVIIEVAEAIFDAIHK